MLELVTADVTAKSWVWGLGGGRTATEVLRQDLRARVAGAPSP